MKVTAPGLIAACVLAQQAAATYNWDSARSYSNPFNTNNECTPDQKLGLRWVDLPTGSFRSYKGLEFSGFDCLNSESNRSLTIPTGSQGKYVRCKVNKDVGAAPKISSSTGKGFSITDMQVSASYDTDIDFVYDMPDGSSCKHTQTCSKGGSNVKNSQCGGAVSVSFKLPQHAKDEDCEVGIHSMGFDCQPASTPSVSSASAETSTGAASSSEATSSTAVTSTEVAEITSVPETPAASTTSEIGSMSSTATGVEPVSSVGSTTPASSPETSPAPSTIGPTSSAPDVVSSSTLVASSASDTILVTHSSTVESPTSQPTNPVETSVPMTTSTIWSTFTSTTYACSSDIPDCPVSSIKIVTMTTAVSTTVCPVSSEAPSIPAASTSTPVPSSLAPVTSVSSPDTLTPVPETSKPASESSASAPETSQPATETKAVPAESTSTAVLPGSTSPPQPSSSQPPLSSESSFPTTGSSTDVSVSSTSSATTVESSEPTPATSEIITTEITYTTTTSCPVTITSTSGSVTIINTSMTVTQTVVTSTVTVCTKCTGAPPTTLVSAPLTTNPAPPATSPVPASTVTKITSPAGQASVIPDSASSVVAEPPATSATPPSPATENTSAGPTSISPGSVSSAAAVASNAPCPEVLPSCLNTWLPLVPKCSSNSDASCFCPSKEFTDAVIGCVQAWGASADEMSAALSYFAGICAASVPQNLAIITAVPSTITLCPTASVPIATGAPTTVAAAVPSQTLTQSYAVTSMVTSIQSAPTQTVQLPVTTISYTQTVSPAAGGSSVLTGAVTVPQVSFITNTAVAATAATGQSAGINPQVITSVGLVAAPVSGSTPTQAANGLANNSTRAGATSIGVVEFTGAAVRSDASVAGAGVAAFAGVLALLM